MEKIMKFLYMLICRHSWVSGGVNPLLGVAKWECKRCGKSRYMRYEMYRGNDDDGA